MVMSVSFWVEVACGPLLQTYQRKKTAIIKYQTPLNKNLHCLSVGQKRNTLFKWSEDKYSKVYL